MVTLTAKKIVESFIECDAFDFDKNNSKPIIEVINDVSNALIRRCQDMNFVCSNTRNITTVINHLHKIFPENRVPKGFDWSPVSNLLILKDLVTHVVNTKTKVDETGTIVTTIGNQSPLEAMNLVAKAIEVKGCYEDLYCTTLKYRIEAQSRLKQFKYYLSKGMPSKHVSKSIREWLDVAYKISAHNNDSFYAEEVESLNRLLREFKTSKAKHFPLTDCQI